MIYAEQQLLATRYAVAALNIYKNPLSVEACTALAQLIATYRSRPSFIFFLQLPLFSYETKREALTRIRSRYPLPEWIMHIDKLLLNQQRIVMLPLVYKALIEQSHIRANRIVCTITAATPLTREQQAVCTNFIAHYFHKIPVITWLVDAALIAGIRIQTTDKLWEDSLESQLRALANTLLI